VRPPPVGRGRGRRLPARMEAPSSLSIGIGGSGGGGGGGGGGLLAASRAELAGAIFYPPPPPPLLLLWRPKTRTERESPSPGQDHARLGAIMRALRSLQFARWRAPKTRAPRPCAMRNRKWFIKASHCKNDDTARYLAEPKWLRASAIDCAR